MIPPALVRAAESSTPAAPPLVQGAGPGSVQIDGQRFVNLASCDYLGLARHPAVLAAATDALTTWGLGSAATRVLSGTTEIHRRLEKRLARFVGNEDAVLHGSCWSANAAVFGTLAELARRSDTTLAVFSDRLNHASLIDGIRTIRAQVSHLSTFDHHTADGIDQLHTQLQEYPEGAARVIVADGVFSMEGDQAPLRRLIGLAREFHALLVVDDSHGIGVLGDHGRGSAEAQQVLGQVDVITGTLGKALGGAGGGFVAGSIAFTTAVRALSRPFIFSNNPPFPVVAAALAALDVLEGDPDLLTTLRKRIGQLREGIDALGLQAIPGEHPIVPLVLGEDERAAAVSHALQQQQVYVNPITFPIVARGEARIRMQVSAAHTADDIDHIVHALAGIAAARR
ncbi:aminotransferase class I/II-fold pyridoxal phosphate-dependent enzyme [Streptomyces rubiginosohelvolus]|uniref:aminotransferase class I/II-fold pyridoxal phosphate-dependent enzyme n=1 Tax=Streptomyces rubiginosohelvolus TaxID=67362 RepID=UPI0037ADE76D